MSIKHYKKLSFAIVFSLFSYAGFAFPSECSVESDSHTTPLIELYTSEGCSSCPPAEGWLTSLKTDRHLSDKVVALAFHVDYWDYIGWKDNFAKAIFSDRQRKFAAIGHNSFVYTPQVLFNGMDYRNWRSSQDFQSDVDKVNENSTKDHIKITLNQSDSSVLKVEAQSFENTSDMELFVALYENDLKSNVTSGENAGHLLQHDYVVHELYGPFKLDSSGKSIQSINLGTLNLRNMGVASFLQNKKNGDVSQSLKLKKCI